MLSLRGCSNMTMQIMDEFIVFGEPMDIVATTDEFFSPKEYGLKKKFMSTACWRGYWCKFTVDEENGLVLNDLHISPSANENVPLNGKMISTDCFGHNAYYKDVELTLPFSGKVLFGKELLYSVDSYMCEAAWGYKTLIELEFVDGKVIGKKNLSSKTKQFQRLYRFSKKIRNITEIYEDEDGTGDYNVKLWWLSYVPPISTNIMIMPLDAIINLIEKIKNVLWKMKSFVKKIRLEQMRQKNDKKYDESKFVFLTDSLESEKSILKLEALFENAEKMSALVISPEAYLSENAVVTYECQLENIGFKKIEFANLENVKEKNILKFDCLFFPDGDPFALKAFIHFRLKCIDEIEIAVKRGVICIAIGEAAVALGEHMDVKHTKHPNSCFRTNKDDDRPFGLGLFRGAIYLSKSKEEREKELSKEDNFIKSILSNWPFREICLKGTTMCVVNGEKEWYR